MNITEVHEKYPHLTVRQLAILVAVTNGDIYTTRIANKMGMFASIISRNVHSLVASGLLTRTEEIGKQNCLKFRLRLTTMGKKVVSGLG